jgi:hypothetical protein
MRVEISIAKEKAENAKGVNGGLERRNDPSNQQAI